jgi:replicative DNA helicase
MDLPINLIYAKGLTVARIRAIARVQAAQKGLDLLIVDYLGLLSHPQRGLSSYERTTAISRELKGLAIELNRPVLALAQLNREAAKSGLPSLEHLRDSGAIEQDADNVWLLHRENRDESDTKLIIAKQRQGPIGTIDLTFDAARMSFDEPSADYIEWTG